MFSKKQEELIKYATDYLADAPLREEDGWLEEDRDIERFIKQRFE